MSNLTAGSLNVGEGPTGQLLGEAYKILASLSQELLSKFTLAELVWIIDARQRVPFSNEEDTRSFRDSMAALAERVKTR